MILIPTSQAPDSRDENEYKLSGKYKLCRMVMGWANKTRISTLQNQCRKKHK